MKLYVLDLGKIIMVGDNPVTDSAQSGAEPLSIPIHAFLVDSPIGYILFDTGCNPEGMGRCLAGNPSRQPLCGRTGTAASPAVWPSWA